MCKTYIAHLPARRVNASRANVLGGASHPVDGDELTALSTAFAQMPAGDRDALRLTLDRLSGAVRRNNAVDRVIVVGIALEAMLLHQLCSPTDRGELRFRASVRGALLVGGDAALRQSNFKALRTAYDARSGAVHSGRIDWTSDRAQENERAIELLCSIARLLRKRGGFPDWDREIVLA